MRTADNQFELNSGTTTSKLTINCPKCNTITQVSFDDISAHGYNEGDYDFEMTEIVVEKKCSNCGKDINLKLS
jgi:phage FluMu protein Com